MRLPISTSSHREKTLYDTTKHARTPHAQPSRTTYVANNDNADSTSQMSKSRRTMQEMYKSAMSPLALAKKTNTHTHESRRVTSDKIHSASLR